VELFRRGQVQIDGILCSGALRTRQTLGHLLESYSFRGKIEYKDEIYASSVSILNDLIRKVNLDSLLLIGHNPEIETLACVLTGQTLTMSTCRLAVINMENGSLEIFFRPKSP
jgi:phosphohistidine phosphatase SixA